MSSVAGLVCQKGGCTEGLAGLGETILLMASMVLPNPSHNTRHLVKTSYL